MNLIWLYTLTSVLAVSLISLIGILTLAVRPDALKKILLLLVSFSAGALLGGAFIHLLPQVTGGTGLTLNISLYLMTGILSFFILEKLICWRHCHIPTSEEHPHSFTYLNLIGDGFHNFMDGMVIAGSFLVSFPLGLSTTLAVALHEIPQEIGDFGVLVYGGFSRGVALALNFASALTAFLGAIAVLVLSLKMEAITTFLIPFTAGGFIYIAGSDLIPELRKDIDPKSSLIQLLFLILGMALMLII